MSFEQAMAMYDVFSGTVIPEPAVLSLAGLAGVLALRQRHDAQRLRGRARNSSPG